MIEFIKLIIGCYIIGGLCFLLSRSMVSLINLFYEEK